MYISISKVWDPLLFCLIISLMLLSFLLAFVLKFSPKRNCKQNFYNNHLTLSLFAITLIVILIIYTVIEENFDLENLSYSVAVLAFTSSIINNKINSYWNEINSVKNGTLMNPPLLYIRQEKSKEQPGQVLDSKPCCCMLLTDTSSEEEGSGINEDQMSITNMSTSLAKFICFYDLERKSGDKYFDIWKTTAFLENGNPGMRHMEESESFIWKYGKSNNSNEDETKKNKEEEKEVTEQQKDTEQQEDTEKIVGKDKGNTPSPKVDPTGPVDACAILCHTDFSQRNIYVQLLYKKGGEIKDYRFKPITLDQKDRFTDSLENLITLDIIQDGDEPNLKFTNDKEIYKAIEQYRKRMII